MTNKDKYQRAFSVLHASNEFRMEVQPMRQKTRKTMPRLVAVCAAGGLIMGLVRRKYGDYPEELPVVLGKIKRERHYDYHPMPVMLVCAFLPRVSNRGESALLTHDFPLESLVCYTFCDR